MRKIVVGDNLDELKAMDTKSVQAVYCDPPYFSNVNWQSVVSNDKDGINPVYRDSYSDKRTAFAISNEERVKITAELPLTSLITGIESIYGDDASNYASFLAIRLIEIRRLLKDTGMVWLQCDDSGGFIIKPLLDAIFTQRNYRGVVYWKRNNGVAKVTRTIPRQIDMIYRYSKHATKYVWNKEAGYRKHRESEIERAFDKEDAGGRYYRETLTETGTSIRRTGHVYELKGVTRRWKYKKAQMLQWDEEGKLVLNGQGICELKRYVKEKQISNLWDDIPNLTHGKNQVGFHTAKPPALIERMLKYCTAPDDLVLDPFCGSGSTGIACENLGLKYVLLENNAETAELACNRINDHIGMLGRVDLQTG